MNKRVRALTALLLSASLLAGGVRPGLLTHTVSAEEVETLAAAETMPTEAPQPQTQAPTEAPQPQTQAPTEAPQPQTQAPTEAQTQPQTQAAT